MSVTLSQCAKRALPAFNADQLAGEPVPQRDWFIDGLIPSRTVTQLNADGATGKSLLMLQVAVAAATGTDSPIGIPKPGPVVFLSAEDDRDEIHRRLDAITRARSMTMESLEDLRIIPLAGVDAVLAATRPGSSSIVTTDLWAMLQSEVCICLPTLLIIDTQADVFAGNENDRGQVRQFIGMLRGLAIEGDLAVVLLAHPSLSGMASGAGSSGSTAWNNSVRSRLYLERVKDGSGVEHDPDIRVLRTMKANYGPRGAEIRLRYSEGRFVPDMGSTSGHNHEATDELFMALLGRFNQEARTVSPSPGANFAPTVFAGHADAKGHTKTQFRASMDRLLADRRIRVASVGPPSRRLKELVIGGVE